MVRKAMDDLLKWKDKNKKPLLLYGARQVGKTYFCEEAPEYYELEQEVY